MEKKAVIGPNGFCTSAGQVTVYTYNPATFFFEGVNSYYLDVGFGIAANSTTRNPGTIKAGEVALFNPETGKWNKQELTPILLQDVQVGIIDKEIAATQARIDQITTSLMHVDISSIAGLSDNLTLLQSHIENLKARREAVIKAAQQAQAELEAGKLPPPEPQSPEEV